MAGRDDGTPHLGDNFRTNQRTDAATPWCCANTHRASAGEGLLTLLSPIALYPDPLLTLVLQASTFPEARLAILHRLGLNRCCEIAGRASAIVAFVGMVSLILVATAADVLH